MAADFVERVSGIAALAEPARRALYDFVVAQPAAVGREEAAKGAGVPLHSAKFHLDRLVDAGLLQTEFRRLTARRGPGAGRPAKLYSRAEADVAVSLPPRHYDVAGRIMARALERADQEDLPVGEVTRLEARVEGRRIGEESRPVGDQVTRATAALTACGYEPRRHEGEVVLVNCPFHALAQEHAALVCGMNEALVAGILDGVAATEWAAVLEPEPEHCCVKVRSRA